MNPPQHLALVQPNDAATTDRSSIPPHCPEALLLDVQGVAECLRVSRTRVFELLASGVLPSVKIGKVRRVRWVDLVAYVTDLQEDRPRSAAR